MAVKRHSDKRVKTASHVRQLMQEQINRLRRIQHEHTLSVDDEVKVAKAIGYLSQVALTSIVNSEIEQRLTEIEKLINSY